MQRCCFNGILLGEKSNLFKCARYNKKEEIVFTLISVSLDSDSPFTTRCQKQ